MADHKDTVRKYKLLAEEYARLRQDAAILKRAVLDEKSRVADADNALKLRDNELKLLAEANERLKSNNERLTKRIASLQQALEESTRNANAAASGQSWLSSLLPLSIADNSSTNNSSENSEAFRVVSEELARKNAENAKLHIELASLKEESCQSIDLLNLKMSKLKDSYEAQLESIRGEIIAAEAKFSAVKDSETGLKQQVKNLTQQLEETKRELTKKEKEVEYFIQEASSEDSSARMLVSRQLLIDDTSNPTFALLNVPSPEFGGDPARHVLISQGAAAANDFLSWLSALSVAQHERYVDMKARMNGDPHFDLLTDKLSELHQEFPTHLDALSKSLTLLKSSIGDNDAKVWNDASSAFQENLNKSVELHQKITTATQLLCLEELKHKDLSQQLHVKIKSIHDGMGAVQNVFERISVSLGLLLEGSLSSSKKARDQNILVVVGHLRESFEAMISHFAKLHNDYEDRFRMEETTSMSQKRRENHAQLVASLESIVTFATSCRELMGSFTSLLQSPPPVPVRGVAIPPSESKSGPFQKRTLKFMNLVNAQKQHLRISYDQQLQNVQTLEVLNRALEITNVENATLQGALNQERNENQSLQTTVSTLKEDIAAKAGTIAKLNTELKDLKQRMEESASLVTQLRSVNAKYAEQGPPVSPRGSKPISGPNPTPRADKSETKPTPLPKPAPTNVPTSNSAPPKPSTSAPSAVRPAQPLPQTTAPPSASSKQSASKSSSYNPFDSFLDPSFPKSSSSSSYNPFAEFESSSSAESSRSSTYNPFDDFQSEPKPQTKQKEEASYNPFSVEDSESSEQSNSVTIAPPPSIPEPPPKPRSSDFNVTVITQDGEIREELQLSPSDIEREQRLKAHYENTVAQLSQQLRLADSKAVDLYHRQQKLERLVKHAKEERDSMQKRLAEAMEKSSKFEKNERDLKEQYEAQIQTLTEHIVKVSEMSARYKEELERTQMANRR